MRQTSFSRIRGWQESGRAGCARYCSELPASAAPPPLRPRYHGLKPGARQPGHWSWIGPLSLRPHVNHTIQSTNSASAREMRPTYQNFYPRSARGFSELREAKHLCRDPRVCQSFPTGNRLAAVLRIKASWHLHCWALGVSAGEEQELGLFRIIDPTITCGEAFPWLPEPRNTCRIQRRSILLS